MHKNGFGINNLQCLMCHKTKTAKNWDSNKLECERRQTYTMQEQQWKWCPEEHWVEWKNRWEDGQRLRYKCNCVWE